MNSIKNSVRVLRPLNLEITRMFQTETNKKSTTATAVLENEDIKSEWDSAKSFYEIPGPKPLPIPYIGNMWRLMPFGTYGNIDLVELHERLYNEFGPLVRLSGLGKNEQLLLFDPKHVELMFRNESIWPIRIGIHSMEYYRTVTRKDFYQGVQGLVTSQGEEWRQFRSATNPTMMQPKNVKLYLNSVGTVLDEFIERIRYIRKPNQEMPDDFLEELNKMALESFGVITLDTRLGCLSNNLSPDSDSLKIIKNVKNAMVYMHTLDFTPNLGKLISTPTWRKYVATMDEILEIAMKHINAKWEKLKNQDGNVDSSNQSVLESLLLKTKDTKIPIVMAADVLFAGIDTTSNSLASILYSLSLNPDKQEKLYQDLKRLLPQKNSPITDEIFNELKYTKAVIKESLRMSPTTIGNQRVAVKDLVFSNYQVPKGTHLLSANAVMCRFEQYFKYADKFLPERWLKSEVKSEISSKNTNPFVFLPFGFGQRSCIGRRFAEMEMELALSKIIRNFKVSYHHEPMTWRTRLVRVPTKPLRYKMEERED